MKTGRYRGVTLVEMMLAMGIMCLMGAALSAALSATISSARINESEATLSIQSQRVMSRLLDQIRGTSLHRPYSVDTPEYEAYLTGNPMTDIGFSLIDRQPGKGDATYTYWWDKDSRKLMVKCDQGETSTSAVLLNNVTEFKVTMWPGRSERNIATGGPHDLLLRAAIVLRITDGTSDNPHVTLLSGSVTPRRNLWTGAHLNYTIDEIIDENTGLLR